MRLPITPCFGGEDFTSIGLASSLTSIESASDSSDSLRPWRVMKGFSFSSLKISVVLVWRFVRVVYVLSSIKCKSECCWRNQKGQRVPASPELRVRFPNTEGMMRKKCN
jgi:hypothetical protein